MDEELREKILHEICLPCVHKGKVIPSGIAGSKVMHFETIPCEYEGTDKYCPLAHKAKTEILKVIKKAGYRKVSGEPPVLIFKDDWCKDPPTLAEPDRPINCPENCEYCKLEAQRDADVRFYSK